MKRFAARIWKPSQFRPPSQKSSQSISTPKTRQFRPAHSQTRLPAQKTCRFRSQHKNEVKFDPSQKIIKLISNLPLKSRHFDPHSKIQSISMPRHKTMLISIQTLKWSQVHHPTLRSSQFWPNIPKLGELRSSKKEWSYFRPTTETKWSSIPALNSSFDATKQKKRVNCDPCTKTK